ncbi:LysR substrate-binding domain-containing protein, partial [Methylophilaceae bacterium]|nr:LysR substrate-binding domain-containing protein [Methylophilaceae bacterium]
HPWNNKQKINAKDLKNEKILLLDNTHCFSMQVREACPGISDKTEVQAGTSLETIRNMVASNLGISILPQSATANNYSNDLINILPFESPIPFRRVAMAFRQGSSKQPSLVKIVKSITSVKEKIIAS